MNTPEQNVILTLKGKKVLFLENDNTLDNGLDVFEKILKDNLIDYKVLFEVSEIPIVDIGNEINNCDCIVFMTQWVYDISKKLLKYVELLKTQKIIVEVYISEPTWYYSSQHGTIHDVYIYSCNTYWGEAKKETEKFYKITDKPYWDYDNKFDK